jgi:hypothetical protein
VAKDLDLNKHGLIRFSLEVIKLSWLGHRVAGDEVARDIRTCALDCSRKVASKDTVARKSRDLGGTEEGFDEVEVATIPG